MALAEEVVNVASPPDSGHVAAFKDAIASVVGSAACVYTGQPLDTIKVRMQAQPEAFNGVFQCLRKTLAEEHVTALWKGSVPALSGAVMENMVAFVVNEQLKRLFPDESRPKDVPPPWWKPIACGGVTGVFTSVVLCPSDVVKCKVQVGRTLRAGVPASGDGASVPRAPSAQSSGLPALSAGRMTQYILRTQGIRGLFVGLGAQFARDVPFYASFFGTYDTIVDQGKRSPYRVPLELLYLFAGGMAGVVGWAVIMPMDTAKSIIQTVPKPRSLIRTMAEVSETQGWRALFGGLNAALIRAFPANAALFLGYELARRSM